MKAQSSGGIGLASVLGVVFVTLKLTNQIDWSWWLVLGPFWMPAAALITVAAVIGTVVYIAERFETPEQKKLRLAREMMGNMVERLERKREMRR